MPFIDFENENKYIRRERYYVDSVGAASTDLRGTRFAVQARLPKRVHYIQSIELTDFSLPQALTPTFFEATPFATGNNKLDVWLGVEPVPGVITDTVEFTAEFTPNVSFTSVTVSALIGTIENALDTALAATGNPAFAGVTFTVQALQAYLQPITSGQYPKRFLITADFNPVADDIRIRFLFESGPNAGNQCERVLGFEPLRDTELFPRTAPAPYNTSGAFTTGVYSTRVPQLQPARYVDVRVEQAQASLTRTVPVGRVFVGFTFYSGLFDPAPYVSNSKRMPSAPRLLTFPVPYTDDLRVALFAEQDRRLNTNAPYGWDVAFDLLLISPEVCLPQWVCTRLGLGY